MTKAKKLLIIGSNSFIAKKLLANKNIKKFHVHLLSRSKNEFSGNFKFNRVNLSNINETKKLIMKVDPNYIIHFADTKIKYKKNEIISTSNINLNFSKNIINSCRELKNIQKIIYLGSCDEYGNNSKIVNENTLENPITYYGRYKLKLTKEFIQAFKKYNLPTTIIRPSVVYGPGQNNSMLIPSMIDLYKKNKFLIINSGSQYRDFLHVEDLVKGIFKIISIENKKTSGKIFNFSYGKSYKVTNIIEIFNSLVMKKYNRPIKVKQNYDNIDKIQYYFIDNKRAKKVLKWTPKFDIKKGLVNTLLNEE